jgi:hypothetical protein
MTPDISSPVLPALRESAMTHLTILLAPRSFVAVMVDVTQEKRPHHMSEANHANARLKRLQESMMSFRKPL